MVYFFFLKIRSFTPGLLYGHQLLKANWFCFFILVLVFLNGNFDKQSVTFFLLSPAHDRWVKVYFRSLAAGA